MVKKHTMLKQFWSAYDFSLLYVDDLANDFNQMLDECGLKTSPGESKKSTAWRTKLSDEVTVMAIGTVTKTTNHVFEKSKSEELYVSGNDDGLGKHVHHEESPIVLVACPEDIDLMTSVCTELQTSRDERIICIILSTETQEVYHVPSSLTCYTDTIQLKECIDNMLERVAFDRVVKIARVLHNLIRTIKEESNSSDDDNIPIIQPTTRNVCYLKSMGLEMNVPEGN